MSVQTHFETHAAGFDALYDDESALRHRWNRLLRGGVYRRVELSLGVLRAMGPVTVLDVGCGSGRNAALFHEHGAAAVHGIDFSQPMLDLAAAHAHRRRCAGPVTFERADLLTWSPKRSWDLVVALGFFDYFGDLGPPLRALRACCRRRVCFSIRRPTPLRMPVRRLAYALRGVSIHFYTARAIEEACAQAGFAAVTLVDGGSGSYFVTAEVPASGS